MVGRSVHKLLRTWFGLLINVLKREKSACAAISLKEGEGGRVIWKKYVCRPMYVSSFNDIMMTNRNMVQYSIDKR